MLRALIKNVTNNASTKNVWGSTHQERIGNKVLAGLSCFSLFAGGVTIAPALNTIDAHTDNIFSPDNFDRPNFT